ncbi:MAG: DUF4175 family protein [Bacteroidetes bacterium]|nr:DUF4175 family protein [Bacteroidota bacterium]
MNETYQRLTSQIAALRRRLDTLALSSGFMRMITATMITMAAALLLEMTLATSILHRWILLGFSVAVVLAAAGFFVGIPLLRRLGILASASTYQLAIRVGMRYPAIKDRLANALQLSESARENPYSQILTERALEKVGEACASLDFTLAADRTEFITWTKRSMSLAAIFALVVLVWRDPVSKAFARLVDPSNSLRFAEITWNIEPGNGEILQGEHLDIQIKMFQHGLAFTPRQISLHWKPAGVETFKEEILRPDTAGKFTHPMPNVRQDIIYYAEAPASDGPRQTRVQSPEYEITVTKRPAVQSFVIEVFPPAYTRSPSRLLEENIGDISASKGSRIHLNLQATKPLQSAVIVFSDSTRKPMTISPFNALRAEQDFVLMKDGSYHISLVDRQMAANLQPVEYRLAAVPDEYPLIKITSPKDNVDVNEQMILPMSLEAQDDYGLSRLLLHYRREKTNSLILTADSTGTLDVSFLLDPKNLSQLLTYTWAYQSLRLQPQDVVSYQFELFDNDPISGPKSSLSQRLLLRFPSLEEILKEVNEKQDETLAKAEDVAKESENLKKELEDIHRDMLKDKKLEWKDQEKIKQLAEKQEALQRQVDEMKKSLEDAVRKMQDNQLLSPETMEKYQELQKLLSEINSPEMQEAMRKLQQAIQNNFDPQQMKEALKDLKFDQDTFKKNIERTLELMKRIKAEQLLDQLVRQSADLAERQQMLDTLSHQIKNDNERQALTKEQDELRKSLEQMQKRGEDVAGLLKQIDKGMRTDALDKARQSMNKGSLQNQMNKNRQSLQEGSESSDQSKKNQEQLERQLDSLQRQMQDARDEFRQQSDQKVMNAMRKIIFDLVQISKDQEEVMGMSAPSVAYNQRFYLNAQAQADVLSGMSRVTENLVDLSNKTFFVTSALGKTVAGALNSMDDAVRDLEQRNAFLASQKQQSAMTAVNDAVKMLMQSVDRMNEGQSGSGLQQLMEELQKMAGQQGGINDKTIPFGQNPGSMTPEQQAALGRLMAEQQALKQSMENAQEAAEDHKDLQGKIGNIAKEMEDVIRDMQQQKVDRQTIERQQRILQRLLDASRSAREKDYSEKRRGETGKEYESKSPRELPKDLTERKNKLRQDLLNELQQGYSKDYEELIRRYFEALGDQVPD